MSFFLHLSFCARAILGSVILASFCHAQERVKPRIAVFPFDDRTTANKDMNIGTKVADLIIAKLATNGAFTVYDRQHIDRLLQEKNLKYDPNYDSASAAKSGLMGTVDVVVSGQVSAFNANTQDTQIGFGPLKKHTVNGIVSLKVTSNIISVEKGSILLAPSASSDQKGVLTSESTVPIPGTGGKTYSSSDARKDLEQGLRKLVDTAAEQVATELSKEIGPSAEKVQPVLTVATPPSTKVEHLGNGAMVDFKASFVGVSGGLSYLDIGLSAGVKMGDKFIVRRKVDTGLKNASGQPIQRHEDICSLIVTSLEDASAAGKCAPIGPARGPTAVPRAGDEVVSSSK